MHHPKAFGNLLCMTKLDEAIKRTFAAYGKVGGRSRSPAKLAAARRNAAKAAKARKLKP